MFINISVVGNLPKTKTFFFFLSIRYWKTLPEVQEVLDLQEYKNFKQEYWFNLQERNN